MTKRPQMFPNRGLGAAREQLPTRPWSHVYRARRLRLALFAMLAMSVGLLTMWSVGLSSAAPVAHTARTTARCGFTGSPYGPLGVYAMKGRVSCSRAEFLLHREFYGRGTLTGNANPDELYKDGWLCGGQMGSYWCWFPTPTNPTRAVEGLACRFGPKCPGRTRVSDFSGPKPTPPIDIAKCVPASYLLPGSRVGLVRVALRQADGFQLREAGHAQQSDLNYDGLTASCSGAMVRRTWYTDLHPPGSACSACDSHEYWVQLRSGVWATLGYFNG
jgi:hypothetical protein